jgi:hypothetical protein
MSGAHVKITGDAEMQRQARLIWLLWMWPARDRSDWIAARAGTGDAGRDNPAAGWSDRTLKKCHDGYGRYLSWLHCAGQRTLPFIIMARCSRKRS